MFEDILANTVSRKIRGKINASNAWVEKDECIDGQHEHIEWLKAEPSLAQQDGRE